VIIFSGQTGPIIFLIRCRRGCLIALGTGAEGLVVVEEEDGVSESGSQEMQGFACKFCSVEQAVKVSCGG
jgi:hypothetical protein